MYYFCIVISIFMVTEDKDLTIVGGEILGLQPRDETAMLVVKKYSFLKNLHENGV